MKRKPLTYSSFLDITHQLSTFKPPGDASSIQNFKLTMPMHAAFAPVTFLVDYSTKKYMYVEESCLDVLGFSASYFLETGLEEYLSKWHPADFQLMDTKVFPANLTFLSTVPSEQYHDYIFSYNYRFKNALGTYITLLQRFSYVPSATRSFPQGVIGVIFDITHFKHDTTIVHTIEKSKIVQNKRVNDLVVKNVYPVIEVTNDQRLSKREVQIIQLIAKGLSSKQIAAQTFLSLYTINNHRKNILAKTSAQSFSEVISYAVKHGLVEI